MNAVALSIGLGTLLLAGCGGKGVAPTSPTPPGVFETPPTFTITGQVVDALSGGPIGGVSVRINMAATVVSDASGRFVGSVPGAAAIRIDISHSEYVSRVTYVRALDPPQTFSLIPASFDLTPFDIALRPSVVGLNRWMTAPALVVITRELQYAGPEDSPVVLDQDVEETKLAGLVADLRDGFLKMTDGRLGNFASVTLESPLPGSRVLVLRDGAIVVARVRDLVKIGFMGAATRRGGSGGVIVRASIMLDRDEDEPKTPHPTYPSHTRKHEMGHAVGFYHVTWDSVMSLFRLDYPQPTDWDVQAARIAYQRPPRNSTPDIDPDPR